jgi:uncharacterized protein (DUF305 family)
VGRGIGKFALVFSGLALVAGAGSRLAAQDPSAGAHAPSAADTLVQPDEQFMHDMSAHHAQAIAMAELVPARSSSDQIKLMAERIDVGQNDEINRMNRWLAARAAGGGHVHNHGPAEPEHTGAHALMPGMLTPEDFAQLRAAHGPAFDRLFLQLMIRHHEGALTMVGQLFATPGAVRDPELFTLASSIDADQRAEIARMNALLSNLH